MGILAFIGRALFLRAFIALFFLTTTLGLVARAEPDPDLWDLNPAYRDSLVIQPIRENAMSRDGYRLALKHFPRPGAQPILLIHGLAQNDRGWDAGIARFSFARFMHAQGFDVWVGNMRNSGTPGFRSETPEGPHHWRVDDFSVNDVPGLIDAVIQATGQRPFLIGHSLAAWSIEGYMAGVGFDEQGRLSSKKLFARQNQSQIKGVITIGGVYNLRWTRPLSEAIINPIRSVNDFYQSNYELELMAAMKPLYHVVPHLPSLPLGWIGKVLNMPLEKIPYIGTQLKQLYLGIQSEVIGTPILSMFFYTPNCNREAVRLHGRDGLEDLGPHLIEQLANAINDKRTSSYYHIRRPEHAYDYAQVRRSLDVPVLMVAGGKDRLATAYEIYQDGYLQTQSKDKQYLHVEKFGHLDVLSGIHAPSEVMLPVAKWIQARMWK